jgi:hypothetical protein
VDVPPQQRVSRGSVFRLHSPLRLNESFKSRLSPADQQQNQNFEWASGVLAVYAWAPACMPPLGLCEPCAFADLKQEFSGDGCVSACLAAWVFLPCHCLCVHLELRKQIAIKHGKNVWTPLATASLAPAIDTAAKMAFSHTDSRCSKEIPATPSLCPFFAAAAPSFKRRSRSLPTRAWSRK